jgi:hypothetical protein
MKCDARAKPNPIASVALIFACVVGAIAPLGQPFQIRGV